MVVCDPRRIGLAVQADCWLPVRPGVDAAVAPAVASANYSDTQPNRMIGQDSDHAGRMAWLENYCHRDPLSSYGHAVFALRKHLERH
jgi:anaerobic selenocysteine-containing dehydrogenase